MKNFFKRFFVEEDGQGMTEYAVILLLIAIAAFIVFQTLGTTIRARFTDMTTDLNRRVR